MPIDAGHWEPRQEEKTERRRKKKRNFSAWVTGRRRSSPPSVSLKGQKAEHYIKWTGDIGARTHTHTPQVVLVKVVFAVRLPAGFQQVKRIL